MFASWIVRLYSCPAEVCMRVTWLVIPLKLLRLQAHFLVELEKNRVHMEACQVIKTWHARHAINSTLLRGRLGMLG